MFDELKSALTLDPLVFSVTDTVKLCTSGCEAGESDHSHGSLGQQFQDGTRASIVNQSLSRAPRGPLE